MRHPAERGCCADDGSRTRLEGIRVLMHESPAVAGPMCFFYLSRSQRLNVVFLYTLL